MPILTPEEYRKRASEIYDPSYAVKIANENTAFNNTMAQYDNQGNMINNNFDRNIEANNRNTALNQNQFNNNTLSRGMARSSAATTGLAGIANTGARVAGEIQQDRTQQLNNLETLKSNLRASLESSLKALGSEHESGIASLAEQLRQRDEDYQRSLVKARASGGSSTPKANGLTAKQITEFKNQIESEMLAVSHNPTERENWINQNIQSILAASGGDTTFVDYLKKKTGEGVGYYYGNPGSLAGRGAPSASYGH